MQYGAFTGATENRTGDVVLNSRVLMPSFGMLFFRHSPRRQIHNTNLIDYMWSGWS